MLRIKSRTVRKRRFIESSRLYDVPWLLTQSALRELVLSHQAAAVARSDDFEDDEIDAEYPIDGEGIACLTISGVLTKSRYWSTTSYSDIAVDMQHALQNDRVKAILLAVHSPGGETGDLFDLADAIYSARQIKPIVAVASDDCYSAAYCLASSAEKLFVTRTGGTGSIGAWTAHSDYSGALQQSGISIQYVYAGARKIDANPTQPLSAPARATLQNEVDRIRELFAQTVSRNRNVSKDSLLRTEGATFMAGAGVPLLVLRPRKRVPMVAERLTRFLAGESPVDGDLVAVHSAVPSF